MPPYLSSVACVIFCGSLAGNYYLNVRAVKIRRGMWTIRQSKLYLPIEQRFEILQVHVPFAENRLPKPHVEFLLVRQHVFENVQVTVFLPPFDHLLFRVFGVRAEERPHDVRLDVVLLGINADQLFQHFQVVTQLMLGWAFVVFYQFGVGGFLQGEFWVYLSGGFHFQKAHIRLSWNAPKLFFDMVFES